eukprot:TRINITY_DN447_c0_g1_i1.p1 TRINITY_DN447_c0_g1~~TRINITY_DN447_c0_g1_i1.p1  ORF type:complete len:343 (-),score=38.03 TRINITY_DN447_c0_g1_i1:34-1062(-)
MAAINESGTENVKNAVSPCNTFEQKMANNEENKCDTCQKLFSNKSNLRKHIKNTHSEIGIKDKSKIIKCEVCDLPVRDNYQLKLHKRKHTNEKPYKCDDCQFPFTRSADLERHKKICKQRIISNFCTKCHSAFKNQTEYNKHALWDTKCGRLKNMKPAENFNPAADLIRVKADSDLDWVGFLPKNLQNSNVDEISTVELPFPGHDVQRISCCEAEIQQQAMYKRSKRKFGCGICEGCMRAPCNECPSCKRTRHEKLQHCTRRKCLHPVHYYSTVKNSKKLQSEKTDPKRNIETKEGESLIPEMEDFVEDLSENILTEGVDLFDGFGLEFDSDVIVMNENVVS